MKSEEFATAMKKIICIFICFCTLSIFAQSVSSPDGKYTIAIDGMAYSITFNGKIIIEKSQLGVDIDNRLFESALGVPRGVHENWCGDLQLKSVDRMQVDTSWTPLYGENAQIRDYYNQMVLHYEKGSNGQGTVNEGYDKRKYYAMDIIVRAYNEGIAFRYHFPETANSLFLHITGERTQFAMPEGTMAWYEEWAQAPYEKRSLTPDPSPKDEGSDYIGEPYAKYHKPKTSSKVIVNPQESDEFNDGQLGLQWQWHANYHQFYGMPTADGVMRLYTWDLPSLGEGAGVGSLWDVPNLLLQKPTAPRFTATAKVRFASKEDNQYGGLVMMGRDYSALVVYRHGDAFLLQRHTCIGADEGASETQQTLATLKPTERDTIPYSPAIYIDMYLRMTVKDGLCRFSYSLDGKRYKEAGEPFKMREGKWIGAKFGFVAECKDRKANRGWLDVDWIKITK